MPFNPEFNSLYFLETAESEPLAYSEYIPSVVVDPPGGILIDWQVPSLDYWYPLTGYTGQYGYSGAIMHVSELWVPSMLDELRELAPVSFAMVPVESPCTPDAPCFEDDPSHCQTYGCDADLAGWSVILKRD